MCAKDYMKKPLILAILDGWGYRKESQYNAIAQAEPQTMQMLMQKYPWTTLEASGTAVGTLPGYAGNSQIGHMAIGTGTIIEQPLMGLSVAIKSGHLHEWKFIQEYCQQLQNSNGRLHIMGLLSDGGVHSHEDHAHALIKYVAECGITQPVIHPFLDGRDVPPQSAEIYLQRLEHVLQNNSNGYIGTMMGRYYAMDRDGNWQRTLQAYGCMTNDASSVKKDWQSALSHCYDLGITDEFIPPMRLHEDNTIQDGDAVIFFNFRADRARQLTALLLDYTNISPIGDIPENHDTNDYQLIPAHDYEPRKLSWMITGTQYHPEFDTKSLYTQPQPESTMCDVLDQNNTRIYRIAETQKYAHITYFFNGGNENTYTTETRTLIPSLDVKHFHNYPEMSAQKITDAVRESFENDPHDFYLINYANADMVGHSGDIEATQQAVTCVDQQIQQLYDIAQQHDAILCITADHGNAEDMYYPEKDSPRTSHTTHPVPFIYIDPDTQELPQLYGLADIAPFLLKQMGIPVPEHMDNSYIINNEESDTDTS